jgi:hypothetical protein
MEIKIFFCEEKENGALIFFLLLINQRVIQVEK